MTKSALNDAQFDVFKLLAALCLSYLTVAMPLPVLSGYVSQQLHVGGSLSGLAVGIAFLSTLLTRGVAGQMADRQGGKKAMQWGLIIYALAGLLCLASGWLGRVPGYGLLLVGRLLLGVGESFTIVGMISWGIGLMPARSGRVMAWLGMGMYGAFALGSPLGFWAYGQWGFKGLMGICVLLPLLGLLAIAPITGVNPLGGQRQSFITVLGKIWRQGAIVGLQGVGFALLGAFISQYFEARGWPHAGWGLSFFGGGFVLMRLLCGHLPDRMGGRLVALGSLVIEAAGQYLLWASDGASLALFGALLTGMGCSMVFPAMGVEVVKRVSPSQRGAALGGFSAFQDLAYGLSAPLCGLMVGSLGFGSVFFVGGLCASLAALALLASRR